MRGENRKIPKPFPTGLIDRHSMGWRRSLESDRKEDDFLFRFFAGDFQGIQWRVKHANIRTLTFSAEQVTFGAGHTHHIAKGRENDVRLTGDEQRLVNEFQRGYTYRATRTMDQLNLRRNQLLDPIFENGMGFLTYFWDKLALKIWTIIFLLSMLGVNLSEFFGIFSY